MNTVNRSTSRIFAPPLLALLLAMTSAQAPAPLDSSSLPSPESQLTLAAREISYFDYRSAQPYFDRALALAAPNSDAWALALYGKATCLYNITPVSADNITQAAALYTQAWNARPDHRAGRLSALNLGRIAELKDFLADSSDLPAARTWYQAVIDKAPDSPEADQAVLRLAGTYIQTYDKADCLKGIDILQKHLASHPDNPLASGMYLYMGDTYFYPLGNDRASLDSYLKADAKGLPQTGKEAILYWRMANLADARLNDPKTAIACYRKILQITPTSGKAYEAGLALKRLSSEPSSTSPSSTSPSSTQDTGRRTQDVSSPLPSSTQDSLPPEAKP